MEFIFKVVKFIVKWTLILFIVLFGMILLGLMFVDTPEEKEAKKQEAIAKEQKLKEDKVKGFHCLSVWDGSLRDDRALKNSLKDPGSYEHISTSITPVNSEGVHTAYVTFRARNGFGGMAVSKATIIVSNETCNNVVLEIQ